MHFFPIREGEAKTLRFLVKDHHLAQGTYRITFSVGTGNFQTQQRDFEILPNVFQFKVSRFVGDGNGAGFAQWEKSWGAVAFASNLEECGGCA
jgi:hypothetical protein